MVSGADLEAARCWGRSVGLACNFNLTRIPRQEMPFRDRRYKGHKELHVAFMAGYKAATQGN